jgi:hypothetical protein
MESEFIVIEIVDNTTIIVDYGIQDGAAVGDTIRIFERGEPVVNPVTNETLGNLNNIKETVQVSVSYEKFSLCNRTITGTSAYSKRLATAYADSIAKSGHIEEKVKLNVDESAFSRRKIGVVSPVKVGDFAEVVKLTATAD